MLAFNLMVPGSGTALIGFRPRFLGGFRSCPSIAAVRVATQDRFIQVESGR